MLNYDELEDEIQLTQSSVAALDKDLRAAAKHMTEHEVRFLVDAYYMIQGNRIRSSNQIRAMESEPHAMLAWLFTQNKVVENNIKTALDVYTHNHPVGEWLHSVKGIGPVIAAGLLAHIDIDKAPTVGHIWRYAGLDPTCEWGKGQKRPWNARLKVLCWKAGESFVKTSNREGAVYGEIYKQRKELELGRNEQGDFREQAERVLATRKIGKETDAYKHYSAGRLPPAHIHARARRYAVKQFLSDLHREMYRRLLGKEPPLPYPIAHMNHVHLIERP